MCVRVCVRVCVCVCVCVCKSGMLIELVMLSIFSNEFIVDAFAGMMIAPGLYFVCNIKKENFRTQNLNDKLLFANLDLGMHINHIPVCIIAQTRNFT